MTAQTHLATQFESSRTHLHSVAYRMLGSSSEADDVVQEAWLRLSRSDTSAVDNLAGWLTTVVARVSLDRLRSRKSRREESLDTHAPLADASQANTADPEQEVLLADSVGPAMLVVLETLAPAERVAFVLHDMFGVSFDEIAPIVGRSPTAARQLASRARRRVRGPAAAPKADVARQKKVVAAFLAASREGDFSALLALLDPDVVLRADAAAVLAASQRGAGAPQLAPEMHGADVVVDTFAGRAKFAQLALLDGAVGAAWAIGGTVRFAFAFTIRDEKISGIEIIVDQARLSETNVEFLDE